MSRSISAAPPSAKPRRARTRRGRAAQNALNSGIHSLSPIIPGVESEDDWLAHLAGVVQSLAPVGHIETLLADRIALDFWRLKRVTRYETLLVTYSDKNSHSESASDEDSDPGSEPPEAGARLDLPELDLDDDELSDEEWRRLENELPRHAKALLPRFDRVMFADDTSPLDPADALAVVDAVRDRVCGFALSSFALPGTKDTPITECSEWTAGLVRRTIRAICERFQKDPTEEIAITVQVCRDMASRLVELPSSGASELSPLATHPLPPAHILDRLVRYEAHVTRDLRQWLSDFERWQGRRLGPHRPQLDLLASEIPESAISTKRNGSHR